MNCARFGLMRVGLVDSNTYVSGVYGVFTQYAIGSCSHPNLTYNYINYE